MQKKNQALMKKNAEIVGDIKKRANFAATKNNCDILDWRVGDKLKK
jgi:2,3-bisphosphoglycerate-independent phosphoglycerate mutase